MKFTGYQRLIIPNNMCKFGINCFSSFNTGIIGIFSLYSLYDLYTGKKCGENPVTVRDASLGPWGIPTSMLKQTNDRWSGSHIEQWIFWSY